MLAIVRAGAPRRRRPRGHAGKAWPARASPAPATRPFLRSAKHAGRTWAGRGDACRRRPASDAPRAGLGSRERAQGERRVARWFRIHDAQLRRARDRPADPDRQQDPQVVPTERAGHSRVAPPEPILDLRGLGDGGCRKARPRGPICTLRLPRFAGEIQGLATEACPAVPVTESRQGHGLDVHQLRCGSPGLPMVAEVFDRRVPAPGPGQGRQPAHLVRPQRRTA